MKEKTILEFNFGDSGCESLTVLVRQNLNQLKIDEIEDAISSYAENSETYLIGEQLIKDVLGSFKYDFEILFPDKVFDI